MDIFNSLGYTALKTNIAFENGWLEDVFPIETVPFQVRAVSFREGILVNPQLLLFFFCQDFMGFDARFGLMMKNQSCLGRNKKWSR